MRMLKPILSQQSQAFSLQVKSAGLAAFLKSAPQRGTIVSSADGKTVIQFQKRKFTVETGGTRFQSGQQVLAREMDGKVLLKPLATSAAQTSSTSASDNSVTQFLAQSGISEGNAELVAQALLKAGIPLDARVLQEVARLLPQLSAQHIPALAFLLSRGLPINQTLVALLSQLLSLRTQPGKNLNRLFSDLERLEQSLQSGNIQLPSLDRKQLSELRQALQRQWVSLNELVQSGDEQELEQLIRAFLATPEALLQSGGGAGNSFGAITLRLLIHLMELQHKITDPQHGEQLQTLIRQTQQLHNILSTQALQNLQEQSAEQAALVFITIPYRDGDRGRDLEVLYRKREDREDAGSLSLRLEFSSLGTMHIGIQWMKPQLLVAITVENESVQEMLNQGLQELRMALQEKGFTVSSLSTRVGVVPETLKPAEETNPPQTFRIDLRG